MGALSCYSKFRYVFGRVPPIDSTSAVYFLAPLDKR